MITINGTQYAANEFAFDGCHKIYLIFTVEDHDRMLGRGYEDRSLLDEINLYDGGIFPIEFLPEAWELTCPLRFIGRADLLDPDPVSPDDAEKGVEFGEPNAPAKRWPEHEKLARVQDDADTIAEFLEWLERSSMFVAEWVKYPEYVDDRGMPIRLNREQLLARYFGVDLDQVEREKREMLQDIRATN